MASGKTQDGLIELDGKLYRRNTAVRAILCIGVDTQGELESYQASGVARQADGLFLAPGYGQGYGPDSDDTQGYDDGDYTV